MWLETSGGCLDKTRQAWPTPAEIDPTTPECRLSLPASCLRLVMADEMIPLNKTWRETWRRTSPISSLSHLPFTSFRAIHRHNHSLQLHKPSSWMTQKIWKWIASILNKFEFSIRSFITFLPKSKTLLSGSRASRGWRSLMLQLVRRLGPWRKGKVFWRENILQQFINHHDDVHEIHINWSDQGETNRDDRLHEKSITWPDNNNTTEWQLRLASLLSIVEWL